MSEHWQPTSANTDDAQQPATEPVRLLAVGAPDGFAGRLQAWSRAQPQLELRDATTLEEARAALRRRAADLVLVAPRLADGSGLALAEELAKQNHLTQTVLIASEPSSELMLSAMRAGVGDIVDPAFDDAQINERLQAVLGRPTRARVQAERAERLHRLCQRLNNARDEVSDQVDSLCSDLVDAYHELAGQVDDAMLGTEFWAVLDNELDLETLLRRTLEFLVRKVGPTNGVVYLPCSSDEFSLGGFVARHSEDGPPQVLLEDLADRLTPAVSEQPDVLHLTDDQAIQRWVGESLGPLSGQHVITFPCTHDDETLAVVALFRDETEPFDENAAHAAAAVAPRLGEALERMIRIHHRHIPETDEESESAY